MHLNKLPLNQFWATVLACKTFSVLRSQLCNCLLGRINIMSKSTKQQKRLCSFLISRCWLGNDLSYAFKLECCWKTEQTSAARLTFLWVQGYTWGHVLIIEKWGKGGEEVKDGKRRTVWQNACIQYVCLWDRGQTCLCERGNVWPRERERDAPLSLDFFTQSTRSERRSSHVERSHTGILLGMWIQSLAYTGWRPNYWCSAQWRRWGEAECLKKQQCLLDGENKKIVT